ncbi:hypothetical protein ACJJTC_006971 [Scirpophaga incertulas]
MESLWFRSELAEEVKQSKDVFKEIDNIVTDILDGRLDIVKLVENMAGVLTDKEAENREKGIKFFNKILQKLPKNYLNDNQVKFISQFYIDRLKDHHRVIPAVVEGFLIIIDMKNYNIMQTQDFFIVLFREVACQSQVRQDRFNIYCLIQNIFNKDHKYLTTLGPDFLYGFISSIDGERDPRNLLFLFTFLPTFLREVPLGHLVEEMFEVLSCYYPIDFHPSPDDPAPVTRQNLADSLCPCLCAVPEFAEHCLVLLVEKLDSSLRVAKLDSLELLRESCNIFPVKAYEPFLKTLWSSIRRELSHKADDEIKMMAHKALYSLVSKLSTSSNTDQVFETFVKGVLISMQTEIAESKTVAQFIQASKVLLTTANASKESCIIITKLMIPAVIAYYEFKPSSKLQIASIDFLGELFALAKNWEVLTEIDNQLKEIPQFCLAVASNPSKDYQIAGFKNLVLVKDVLDSHLVLPFIEILMHNVQYSHDEQLFNVSVDTIHAIGRKYPEMVMELVVKGKCDVYNMTINKDILNKHLKLLSNLASIDYFTKVIFSEMIRNINDSNEVAGKVIKAVNITISNSSLYSEQKLKDIESDYRLIDAILGWLSKTIYTESQEVLTNGYDLVANIMSSLPSEKQIDIISKYTEDIWRKTEKEEVYFNIIECLYRSLHQNVYSVKHSDIMRFSLNLSLHSNDNAIRSKACMLAATLLNKSELGQQFDCLYNVLNDLLSHSNEKCDSPRLLILYGWITKALIMRGSAEFTPWLQKIVSNMSSPEHCKPSSSAIRVVVGDPMCNLGPKQHSRLVFMYKQRLYQNFSVLTSNMGYMCPEVKNAYLTSWAYVLQQVPKSILNNDAAKLAPLVIDSLELDNKNLLLIMLDVLSHILQNRHLVLTGSLQTILPRLVRLSKFEKCMDVRIKSLQCLYIAACVYPTFFLRPHKQDMLLDLETTLDDSKRLVRRNAVKTRTRWFMVGAPGEAKEV